MSNGGLVAVNRSIPGNERPGADHRGKTGGIDG
jgi:hypothetical protein